MKLENLHFAHPSVDIMKACTNKMCLLDRYGHQYREYSYHQHQPYLYYLYSVTTDPASGLNFITV